MRQFKDLAFILKRGNFGEADSLITVFSKNHGKLKILVKGSRKIKSKFVGHIEPFSLVKISVLRGKSFEILTSCQIEKSFYPLKEKIENLSYLNLISETIDSLTGEKIINKRIFDLILKSYSSALWRTDQDFLIMFFIMHLLDYLGFSPRLDYCLKCSNKNIENAYFSYYWGGILCKKCLDHHSGKSLDQKTIDILNLTKDVSISNSALKTDKVSKGKALKLILDFFNYINEKKPNSLKFLEKAGF